MRSGRDLKGLDAMLAKAGAPGGEDLRGEVMDFWVDNYGAASAAWLLWKYRRQIRRAGAQDFEIPKNAVTPPWFRVAMETLKRREGRWSVSVRYRGAAGGEVRVYRVEWLGSKRERVVVHEGGA